MHVTVLDSLTYAASPEALNGLPEDRFELVVGDVADEQLVNELVGRLTGPEDAVVHFAAESDYGDYLLDLLEQGRGFTAPDRPRESGSR